MNVLALATRREGFPTVALEAAAAGKPVVTTRATGAMDAVLDGQTGILLPQRDAAALAAALGRVLAEPGTAMAMGRRGRAWVEREFAPQRPWRELRDVYVRLLADTGRANTPKMSQPTQQGSHAPLDRLRGQRRLKRSLDVVIAGCGLVVLAPLFAVVALAVLATMGRPVLFRQIRIGLREEPFELVKFRTMTEALDSRGQLLADGERLTRLGRWLRRLSIDELPQLCGVLRGEMSLVGPRPLLSRYLPFYSEAERSRHQVPPGLTGWAQIHGRNRLGWNERLALDTWYAAHWSLALDLKILARTVGNVLWARGVDETPSESRSDLDVERARAVRGAA
jgi:lipopolysaccharide/colanic/teichoic acid biosynthesis glycosyltransferase